MMFSRDGLNDQIVDFAKLLLCSWIAACLLLSLVGTAFAQASRAPQEIGWLKEVGASETFLAAKLTLAERKQIIRQVEGTAFDAPDSWTAELRVRRLSLGQSAGLLIRGTRLLCGGTGNCQTWVFRRAHGTWLNVFEHDAPIGSGFGFGHE